MCDKHSFAEANQVGRRPKPLADLVVLGRVHSEKLDTDHLDELSEGSGEITDTTQHQVKAYQFASVQARAEASEVRAVRLVRAGVEGEARGGSLCAERLQHGERMFALVELARRIGVRLRSEGLQRGRWRIDILEAHGDGRRVAQVQEQVVGGCLRAGGKR